MVIEMSVDDALRMRLKNQLVGGSTLDPTAVVERAVALQGQDLPAVLRAIAVRSAPGTTLDDVRRCFDTGALIRSWPMRGTLFASTPRHVAALLPVTGPRHERAARTRRRGLGIDDDLIGKARASAVAAVSQAPQSRAQLMDVWQDIGIETSGGVGYHLLLHLAVEQTLCWGPFAASGKEQLLVLFPDLEPADQAQGLQDVIRGYIRARGPVTLADMVWWTKLPKSVLRPILSTLDEAQLVMVAGTEAFVIDDGELPEPRRINLLPGFDEWILGYGDRSWSLTTEAMSAVAPGGNGVFRPVIVRDGKVIGTWRIPAGSTEPMVDFVETVTRTDQLEIDKAFAEWPFR